MKSLAAILVVALAGTAHAERDALDLLSEGAAHAHAGRHPQAIALYEQAYKLDPDQALLPIIAVEYRRAGAQLVAVQHFCAYLLLDPNGEQALFATRQVIAIRRELGELVDPGRVCGPVPQRVDFAPQPQPKARAMSRKQMAAIAPSVSRSGGGITLSRSF